MRTYALTLDLPSRLTPADLDAIAKRVIDDHPEAAVQSILWGPVYVTGDFGHRIPDDDDPHKVDVAVTSTVDAGRVVKALSTEANRQGGWLLQVVTATVNQVVEPTVVAAEELIEPVTDAAKDALFSPLGLVGAAAVAALLYVKLR